MWLRAASDGGVLDHRVASLGRDGAAACVAAPAAGPHAVQSSLSALLQGALVVCQ